MSKASTIAAIYNPSQYNGQLPTTTSLPLIRKSITPYAVFTPGGDVQQSGALIWNTRRGCYSMGVFGFVANLPVDVSPVSTPTSNLTWPLGMATAKINLSPDVSDTISLARVSSGEITVYSATTSTTLAALNGQLTAASIIDLRNTDFTPPSLMQAAITDKDAFTNVRVARGVSAVVGPDVAEDLSAVNFDNSYHFGDTANFTFGSTRASNAAPGSLDAGSWGIYGATAGTDLGNKQPIPTGIDVKFRTRCQFNRDTTPLQATLRVIATLGTVDQTGNVITTATRLSGTVNIVGGVTGDTFIVETSRLRVAFGQTLVHVNFVVSVDNAAGADLTMTNEGELFDAYGDSGMGSYRVLRWDNVDNTQTINIKGMLMIEGVPTGAIAPYVKGDPTLGGIKSGGQIMAILRTAYSSLNSQLRRVFVSDDKDNIVNSSAASSVDSALSASGMYSSGMYADGMYASGLFGDIGHVLGSVAGTGLSLLGNTVDGVLGLASGESNPKRARHALGTVPNRIVYGQFRNGV